MKENSLNKNLLIEHLLTKKQNLLIEHHPAPGIQHLLTLDQVIIDVY